jgi:hypothetical protein
MVADFTLMQAVDDQRRRACCGWSPGPTGRRTPSGRHPSLSTAVDAATVPLARYCAGMRRYGAALAVLMVIMAGCERSGPTGAKPSAVSEGEAVYRTAMQALTSAGSVRGTFNSYISDDSLRYPFARNETRGRFEWTSGGALRVVVEVVDEVSRAGRKQVEVEVLRIGDAVYQRDASRTRPVWTRFPAPAPRGPAPLHPGFWGLDPTLVLDPVIAPALRVDTAVSSADGERVYGGEYGAPAYAAPGPRTQTWLDLFGAQTWTSVRMWVDGSGRPVRLIVQPLGNPGGKVDLVMFLREFGAPVTITTPPPDQVGSP